MNDLSKEELEAIRDNLVVPECFNQKSILYAAYQKILVMIDDYCDHPENMSMYSLGVEYCAKCKRKLNE